jgi:hypothetical protein
MPKRKASQTSIFGGITDDDDSFKSSDEEKPFLRESQVSADPSNSRGPTISPKPETTPDEGATGNETDDNDEIDDRDPKRLKQGKNRGLYWRLHTAQDRATYEGVKQEDSRDLAKHLVQAHGFAAEQYAKLPPTADLRWMHRPKWTSEWTPPRTWVTWPLPPEDAPRSQNRVWRSSVTREEQWTPSHDLEEELFAFMLKRARKQWDGDVTVDLKDVDSTEASPEARKKAFEELNAEDLDKPLISTDDEKSRRILQPMIRSILSKFDNVLAALNTSRDRTAIHPPQKPFTRKQSKAKKNTTQESESDGSLLGEYSDDSKTSVLGNHKTKAPQKARSRSKQATQRREPSPRTKDRQKFWKRGLHDWSQVLGMASIVGVSPAVIARATTRCSALLNETMDFHTLQGETERSPADWVPILNPKARKKAENPPSTTDPVQQQKFKPSDILQSEDPADRFNLAGWKLDLQNLKCPFRECNDGRTGEWTSEQFGRHMTQTHGWDMTVGPPEDLEDILYPVGGVQTDGYLQPLEREYSHINGIIEAVSKKSVSRTPVSEEPVSQAGSWSVTRKDAIV